GSKPFMVAGYSFAGLMAFEAAQQLKGRGALVEAVLLFDTVARAPSPISIAWNEVKDLWNGKAQLDRGVLAGAVRIFREAPLRWAGGTVARRDLATSELDARELSLAWALMEKLYETIRKQYRPSKLDCRGIVVTGNTEAETLARRSAGHDLGWN